MKKEIEKRFPIHKDHIVFHATHNHSGPQTSSRFSEKLGVVSSDYLYDLSQKMIDGIEMAFLDLEKVDVQKYSGDTDIGVNRRREIDGEVMMAPNPDGSVDSDLTLLSFVTKTNYSKAIWIHHTCHPTSTDANVISSEYIGVCCEKVEEEYPGSCVAFLQGFCGDIRPSLVDGDYFYKGSIEDMNRLGEKLFTQVMDVLGSEGEKCAIDEIRYENETLPLMFCKGKITVPNELEAEWPRLVRSDKEYKLEMGYIVLGEKLKFFTCNAEMVHEYGLFLKRKDNSILPLGYSNGMIGYIPTASQILAGGYEAKDSLFFFGYPNMLSPTTQGQIEDKISSLL